MIDDDKYLLNQVLYNMKEVIVELYAWTFVNTYGPLEQQTAGKLLALPGLSDLYLEPDFRAYVKALDGMEEGAKLGHPLFTCFGFISAAVKRWKTYYQEEYLASQRRIRFLHQEKTIERLKDYLNETNKSTKLYPEEWKRPNKAFLESLPMLPE